MQGVPTEPTHRVSKAYTLNILQLHCADLVDLRDSSYLYLTGVDRSRVE